MVFFLLISIEGISQKSDLQLIEETIDNYFNGWLTGDTTLVGSAMHATCILKFIRDGKVERRDRTNYLSGFNPRPRLADSYGKIVNLDITNNAAAAKVILDTSNRHFTDYFNLLKAGERWYITDKVSTSYSK